MDGLDPTKIIACAMRPSGSWMHLMTLVGFVVAAWAVSPRASRNPLRSPAPGGGGL